LAGAKLGIEIRQSVVCPTGVRVGLIEDVHLRARKTCTICAPIGVRIQLDNDPILVEAKVGLVAVEIVRIDLLLEAEPIASRITGFGDGKENEMIARRGGRNGAENPAVSGGIIEHLGVRDAEISQAQPRPEVAQRLGAQRPSRPILDTHLGVERHHQLVWAHGTVSVRRNEGMVVIQGRKALDGGRRRRPMC